MSMLQQGFPAAQMMVCGVLGPKSNAHGPNEFLHVPMGKKLTCCVAQVLGEHFARPALNVVELGVRRISAYANASNHAVCRLNKHFGYSEEARLRGAAPDGGDVIVFVMWREDCRFLREG